MIDSSIVDNAWIYFLYGYVRNADNIEADVRVVLLKGAIERLRIILVKQISNRCLHRIILREEMMAATVNIITKYSTADSATKVDIIVKYYPDFLGIVESYTDGLRYMIENEKAYNRKSSHGELGIRVQSSGAHSDITANTAIANVITRDAIVTCDFSGGVLEGVDRAEEYERNAWILHDMRQDYQLYTDQFGVLKDYEREELLKILNREITLSDLAEQRGIEYTSVQKRVHNYKKQVKDRTVQFMNGEMGGM